MKKVLIIDDEPEALELLEYFFLRLNYEVVAFPDVVPVAAFENILPDVVVLDNNLGKTSGGELCLKLKNNTGTRHIPVVLLSANDRIKQIAKDSRADAYVAKPFDIGNLHETVKCALMINPFYHELGGQPLSTPVIE